jgi:nuclear pore complex protein Nup188
LTILAILTSISSWKTIFTSLLQLEECDRSSTSIKSFFSEPDVIKLLSRPFNPFSFSQANTKTAFETKTAAINVTPTTKSTYSIQEIKEDSLWLSKEAQIDEISALRIVVLEYQSRSAAQLQGEFSDEEAVSLQEAAGNINTESSNLLSLALKSRTTTSSGKSETGVESRRCRLLQIYLSERRNLFACTNIILHTSLRYLQGKGKQAQHQPTWTDQVSELFIQSQDLSSHGATDFLNYYIKSFKTNIEGLNEGSGWFKADGGREDLELEWLNTRIAEAIHTLELSLLMLSYCTDVRTPGNLLEWFRFVSEKGYFDQFVPVSGDNSESFKTLFANILHSHTPLSNL